VLIKRLCWSALSCFSQRSREFLLAVLCVSVAVKRDSSSLPAPSAGGAAPSAGGAAPSAGGAAPSAGGAASPPYKGSQSANRKSVMGPNFRGRGVILIYLWRPEKCRIVQNYVHISNFLSLH
jgi:hypothetical protein